MISAPTPQSFVPAAAAELSASFHKLLAGFVEQLERQTRAEIESQVHTAVESAVDRAVELARSTARRELAEELNQASRRLRQCEDAGSIFKALSEAASGFCHRAAMFTVGDEMIRASYGAPDDLEFPVQSAAAFAGIVENREPAIAAALPAEIGTANLSAFGHPADDRVYLFPITTRRNVVAVLYAVAGSRGVEFAPLELLAGLASGVLDALTPEAAPAEEKARAGDVKLVAIQPAQPSLPAEADWSRLPPDLQEEYLKAQRLARVLVAEIRLYHPDRVRSGRTRRDLYGVLREQIDEARKRYRENLAGRSMVDYLHAELVRTLAHDDARLLGPSYPGPMGRDTRS